MDNFRKHGVEDESNIYETASSKNACLPQ